MFQCVVCSHLTFPHFFKHMSGDLDQTFRLQSFFFPFSLHQSHWQILWSFLCADSQCQGTSLSWCWCLRASLILKSPLIPVPHTLVAFFSNKFSLGRCPWTFEPSQVPKWPSTLGLPVLLSWLLAVFRVRRKLLGTAWASFRPLATYFLPFLLSLLQWGRLQKRLFLPTKFYLELRAHAPQPFTDFSRWPGVLPQRPALPLLTVVPVLLGTEPKVGCMPGKRSTKERFEPSAHSPLTLSPQLFASMWLILGLLGQWWALSN